MTFALLVVAVCLATVAAVRIAVGAHLPQTCPRRLPLPVPEATTLPLPVGVTSIRERLLLEELGRRWYRDGCGAA